MKKTKIATNKLSMQPTNERQHMTRYWPNSLSPQWSRQAVITVSRYDLDDHKNKKWSRHRSFLYRCDRSSGIRVLKLGIEIPNLKQHNWSTKNGLRILKSGSSVTCEEGLAPS